MSFIGTLIGCSPLYKEAVHDSALIGMDVSRVIQVTGFIPERRFVIDEPPGVPRGIRGIDRRGDRIEVYVSRGDVPFSERMEWRLQEFQDKSVIGIAREQEGSWSTTGEVMLIRRRNATQQATRNSEQDARGNRRQRFFLNSSFHFAGATARRWARRMRSRLMLNTLGAALCVAAFTVGSKKAIQSSSDHHIHAGNGTAADSGSVLRFTQAAHRHPAKSTPIRPRRKWISDQVFDSASGEGLGYVDLVIRTSTGEKRTETFPNGEFLVPLNPGVTEGFTLTASSVGYSEWSGEFEPGTTVSLALEPRQMDFERARKNLGLETAF